ncbi:hypothetical protein SSAG_04282 [Streptomyces sp. Mg1]|nr:hypothetical protein SSAG_04282 [Streptomyces sp. Mg1]
MLHGWLGWGRSRRTRRGRTREPPSKGGLARERSGTCTACTGA